MNNYALAFLCGFLTCFGSVCFPVVLALCLRLLKRARTHKALDGRTCYPDEMDPVEWLQLRNVMTSLGFTTTVTYVGKRKVARFVLKEPVS